MHNNYLIVIIGPTAIGKTKLAIELAHKYRCSIISCDSRQFFKEMSIGTAVPSKEELNAATHYFIQNKSIFEPYSVGDFEREALEKLDKLFKENSIQIMVGGSGLYVDAILKCFDEFPEVSPDIKQQIEDQYAEKGLEFLQNELKTNDISYYNFLSTENPQTLENPQRMKRFVSVCWASGLPYSSFLNQEKNKRNFTPIIISLSAERQVIYDRINQRVDLMIKQGLIEEVKNLLPYEKLNALQTVGYHEIFDFLNKKISEQEAIEEIKKNTRRFAKRQLTWFKRYDDALHIDYKIPTEKIIELINKKMASQE